MAMIIASAGDSRKYKYTVRDLNKALVNITGATISWKLGLTENGAPTFTKTVGSGITIVDGPNGRFDVDVATADTSTISGDFKYEAKMTLATNQQVIDRGGYHIKPVMT